MTAGSIIFKTNIINGKVWNGLELKKVGIAIENEQIIKVTHEDKLPNADKIFNA